MFQILFLIILTLIWIIFATIQDIKKREVANWLNFSLVIFALSFRFFYSLFYEDGFSFFYQGIIGFGIFLVLGNLFYYGKMFAGGDAKLMIALGAVLPFSSNFYSNLEIFGWFFILFLIVGAVYSLVWSVVLTIRNFNNFKKEFSKQLRKSKRLFLFVLSLSVVLLIFGFFEYLFFVLGILLFILPYLYIYVKSVDEVCMVKRISVAKLEEGDWLYKDIKIGKKLIKARWNGLSKQEINLLRKRKKFVVVRQGIPFTPVFLISFILTYFFWKLKLWNSFW